MIHSFHLAETPVHATLGALLWPPRPARVPGLVHAECMTVMTLGAGIVSPARLQLRRLAVFASWRDPDSLDGFLAETRLGRRLADGWHVRLTYLRRWGRVEALDQLPAPAAQPDPFEPVVAITLARMRLLEVPRFVRWGRPVERLVRDHPGTTLAGAAMRLPRTVCTFSIWRSQREMTDMVRGVGSLPDPDRHALAMVERARRPFHHEFTTLRFRCLSEHGEWVGRRALVPAVQGRSVERTLAP